MNFDLEVKNILRRTPDFESRTNSLNNGPSNTLIDFLWEDGWNQLTSQFFKVFINPTHDQMKKYKQKGGN